MLAHLWGKINSRQVKTELQAKLNTKKYRWKTLHGSTVNTIWQSSKVAIIKTGHYFSYIVLGMTSVWYIHKQTVSLGKQKGKKLIPGLQSHQIRISTVEIWLK